jgi:hypothetical protein
MFDKPKGCSSLNLDLMVDQIQNEILIGEQRNDWETSRKLEMIVADRVSRGRRTQVRACAIR